MWIKHYFKSWGFYFNTEMDSNQHLGSEYSLNFLEAQVWTLKPTFTFIMNWTIFQIFLHSWALQKSRLQLCGLGWDLEVALLKYFMCLCTPIHPHTLMYTHTNINTPTQNAGAHPTALPTDTSLRQRYYTDFEHSKQNYTTLPQNEKHNRRAANHFTKWDDS